MQVIFLQSRAAKHYSVYDTNTAEIPKTDEKHFLFYINAAICWIDLFQCAIWIRIPFLHDRA